MQKQMEILLIGNTISRINAVNWNLLVVASFTEIKTSYWGFETKRNPVFCMLVLCIENYSQAYMSDNL